MSYRKIILNSPQNKNYNVSVVKKTKGKICIYTYIYRKGNARQENTVCVFSFGGFLSNKNVVWEIF